MGVCGCRHGVGKIDHLDKILRSKKKTALTGLVSQLKAIEGALLHYIFEHREQGVMVNTFMVALRVSFILPEFHEKSFTMRCSCVKRFLIAHSFSYRMGMHTSQHPPAKIEGKAFVSCDSCAALSAVAIATGISSLTWTKHRSISQ